MTSLPFVGLTLRCTLKTKYISKIRIVLFGENYIERFVKYDKNRCGKTFGGGVSYIISVGGNISNL